MSTAATRRSTTGGGGEAMRLHCLRIERIARIAEDLAAAIGEEAAALRAGERPNRTLGSLEAACCTLQRVAEFATYVLDSEPQPGTLLDAAVRWGRGER
jgi:hypothetical protein